MIAFAWVTLLVLCYVLSVLFFRSVDVYFDKMLLGWCKEDDEIYFMAATLWPLTLPMAIIGTVYTYVLNYEKIDSRRTAIKKQKQNEQQIQDRKDLIRSLRVDSDSSDLRRKEVLSGAEIIDPRSKEHQDKCYVCFSAASPYATGKGTMIKTINGISVHEECLLGDLTGQ